MLRKLALLGVFVCLAAPGAQAQSLFYPAGNDFETAESSGFDQFGTHVAAADFDQDGNLDAVVTLEAGTPSLDGTQETAVLVFLGDGHGLFLPPARFELPVQSFAGDVVTGQFDSDGIPDFAVAVGRLGGGGPTVSGGVILFFNDGSGGFDLASTQMLGAGDVATGPPSRTGLVAGRIDSDTLDDLVVLNSADNTFSVFLSKASYMPSATSPEVTCMAPAALALGDLRLPATDTNLDLAIACDPGTGSDSVEIWQGADQGGDSGNFSLTQFQLSFGSLNDPRALAIADLNGDGANDIAVANSALGMTLPIGTVTLIRNDLGGFVEFDPNSPGVDVGDAPRSIQAADLDGDGDQDLLLANWFTGDLSILEASIQGSGSAAAPVFTETFFPTGFQIFDAVFADLDGKGNLDILTASANNFTGTLSSFLGGGNNLVQRPERFISGNLNLPSSVAVADFDGDGIADFAAPNFGQGADTLSIFRSTAADLPPGAPFALLDEEIFSPGDLPFDVLAADLSSPPDGTADLLLVLLSPDDPVPGQVVVLQNTGTGSFTPVGARLPVGVLPYTMVLADLNSDGVRDLAVTSEVDHTVTLFQGGGGGTSFTFQGTFLSSNGTDCTQTLEAIDCSPRGLAAGDINGDNLMDLVVADVGSPLVGSSVQVFTGDGAFNFSHFAEISTPDPFSDPNNPNDPLTVVGSTVLLADLDGTNGLDIVATAFAPDDIVSVFLNDGSGNFSPAPGAPFFFPAVDFADPAEPFTPRSALLVDLNNDGCSDLAATAIGSNNLGVLLGGCDGTFIPGALRADAFGTVAIPRSLGIGDVTGDGLADVIVTGGGDVGNVSVLESGFAYRSDLDLSGRVDGFDLAQLGFLFGLGAGSPQYDFFLDVNMDGTIDGMDQTLFALAFGQLF
ncbi:MAG: FG-GAP-like repeat-containing protein [Acidobacteriota bacterium]